MSGEQRINERRIIVHHSNDGRSGARLHLIRTDELPDHIPGRPPPESV